jgi:multidrug efflux pump subunit AcrB
LTILAIDIFLILAAIALESSFIDPFIIILTVPMAVAVLILTYGCSDQT